jgi:chemotaxis protein MotB
MSRRKKHAANENHERWLVSYADFITLLFAFFVVMFASSQTDKGKAQQVSDSVTKALDEKQVSEAIAMILGGTRGKKGPGNAMMKGPGGSQPRKDQQKVMEQLKQSLAVLQSQLKAEIDAGKMEISLEPRGLVLSLREAAFFPSGEDAIAPDTYPILEKIAEAIRKLDNPVRLEGHTDALPIHNSRFRSNWELSAARSIAVLELLANRFDVPRNSMAIAGYAETVPIAPNTTSEGRARNRRVDIVILNPYGASSEPEARNAPPAAAKPPPPKASK